jgi:hypothetical protein
MGRGELLLEAGDDGTACELARGNDVGVRRLQVVGDRRVQTRQVEERNVAR